MKCFFDAESSKLQNCLNASDALCDRRLAPDFINSVDNLWEKTNLFIAVCEAISQLMLCELADQCVYLAKLNRIH